MNARLQDFSTRLMKTSESISADIKERIDHGVSNASESQAYIVESLRSFDEELTGLDQCEREAIMSVFRKELSLLIIMLQMEASIMALRALHHRRHG